MFALFKFLASYFNKIKMRQNLIEEDMLFKIELKENLNEINTNIDKDDFIIVEEKMKEDLECINERSNEISKLNEINLSINENYQKLDLSDYSSTLINLLSCKCKARVSNKVISDIIYEYYESLIDIGNVFLILNQFKNSIKSSITSKKNVINKKILLKIKRKNLSINEKPYEIQTFKIQRNKKKFYNK